MNLKIIAMLKHLIPILFIALNLARGAELKVSIWNVERGANHFENGSEKALKVIQDAGDHMDPALNEERGNRKT